MTPQLERLTALCKQLNLLHLPTQIAHLGQMAAKRELGYLDFLEQALKDEAMARAERMRRMLTRLAGFPAIKTLDEFDCVFHTKLDSDFAPSWTGISREAGHGFHGKLDSDFTRSWTVAA